MMMKEKTVWHPRNVQLLYSLYWTSRTKMWKIVIICGFAFVFTNFLFFFRASTVDTQAQSYFDTLQCERPPLWFYEYMKKKRLSDPLYIPTIAVLTTTANRLWYKPRMVAHAIESMNTEQTSPPDAVFMVIPEYSMVDRKRYRIPTQMEKQHLLKACRDYGPATKFIAPLRTFGREFPDARLISFDDDMLYDKHTVQIFHKYSNQFPNQSVCARGNLPDTESNLITTPVRVKYPLAVFSMMYSPRQFDLNHLLWTEELRPDFFREDDCWFGCLAKSNNFEIYVVPGLKPIVNDGCPLGQCLHYNMDIWPSIRHLTKKDTCNHNKHLNWNDEYFPESIQVPNSYGRLH